MAIQPIPAFPALSDRADGSYNGKAFAWATHMADTFVPEANALAANLNSIAAGGAYAIPYGYSAAIGSGGPGKLVMNTPTPSTATALIVDTRNASRTVVASALSSMGSGSTSAVKGQIRISTFDSSKWAIFNVTSYTQDSLGFYGTFLVQYVASSSASPFAEGDAVLLFFQRTGDKGDPGSSQAAKFSDRKATGTSGGATGTNGSAATVVRTLNTTEYNTIPSGVSLSANRFTLPAGTYDIWGRAPATSAGAHKTVLWNVTGNVVALVGTSAFSGVAGGATQQSDSEFSGRLVLAAATQFEVRHTVSQATNFAGELGIGGSSSGQSEIFTEVLAIKAI